MSTTRPDTLPALVDRPTLAREMGVKRSTVDAIFRELTHVAFPGSTKVYVLRADVAALLERSSFPRGSVR